MVETDRDRDIFLSDFSQEAYLDGAPIRGIFDNTYVEVDMGGESSVASAEPTFLCKSNDLELLTVAVGQILNVNSKDYIVRVIMPDGLGMTTLVLELF